jgi:tRNA threonylcarbamoyladenosine biosynthesis protein TsaB
LIESCVKILIIDTCGATGSVALADTEREAAVVANATLPGRSASERLVATIKDLTSRPGLGLETLGAVAVVHGPGSFTGVRVGLSAAKGLCEALDLPLIAISRLAVMAEMAKASRVFALLDAGRGEFYLGEYNCGVRVREALVDLEQVLRAAGTESAGMGETAVVTCQAAVAKAVAALAPRLNREPSAEDALPLVLRHIQARDFDDAATIDANYLRRTDAEIFAKPTVAGHTPRTQA